MFGSGSKISLDSDLLKRCREHAKSAGYSSVEEFIQHALETVLRKTATVPEDDPRVLERLKGLGYIE
jgi:metal-responsive CopG/Arc/MetJ family transcriptional regulator